jgi:hypothetical protein
LTPCSAKSTASEFHEFYSALTINTLRELSLPELTCVAEQASDQLK